LVFLSKWSCNFPQEAYSFEGIGPEEGDSGLENPTGDALRKTLYLLLALFALVSGSTAQTASFATTAEIDQASLKTNFYEKDGRFYAKVTVRNISGTPKVITVWGNPGWSWVTDSMHVVRGQEALQNSRTNIRLNPGEIYRSSIEMATNRKGKRPIIFRLRYISDAERPLQDARDPAVIWTKSTSLAQ
jgi:hypothetical protein